MSAWTDWRMARRTWAGVTAVAVAMALTASVSHAQEPFDDAAVALTYHKLSGDPLDMRAAAERSDVVRRANSFDRPDAINTEAARLQAAMNGANASRVFVIRVNDAISDYDHQHGEFTIELFRAGAYVPVNAFGQQYQLVFANASRVRAIAMPKDQARDFDATLRGMGRQVTNEIQFRVIGQGDPAGAVTGARVIRAEIVSARLLDRSDHVVFTPNLTAAPAATPATPFDLARADVAGFRIGVKGNDLEAALRRLFGNVERGPAGRNAFRGIAEQITVNGGSCYTLPGRRNNPEPGAVCVTALLDGDGVVRAIRIERVFAWMDAEVFRQSLVQKYGDVTGASGGGGLALGWGPPVDPALLYSRSGPAAALTAFYASHDDYLSRGLNRLPQIRVVLNLVDAGWAALQR